MCLLGQQENEDTKPGPINWTFKNISHLQNTFLPITKGILSMSENMPQVITKRLIQGTLNLSYPVAQV